VKNCAVAWILLFPWLCIPLAQAQIPATQPALGPRDALKSFFDALTQGRPDDIATLCSADDPRSKALVKDLVDMSAAMMLLRKQVAARFGSDQLDAITGVMPTDDDVDEMDEKINDHVALIVDKFGDPPLRMVLQDGRWKLDIADLRQSDRLSNDPHAFVLGMTGAIQRTTADVNSGRLTSPGAVRDALAAREIKIATAGDSASRPSSTTAP
jgi:hypothetical protein